MVNKEIGKILGEEIGSFMDADAGDSVSDAGSCLRVKVRMNIANPLRRGIKVYDEVRDIERWCPLRYEFLPEFCFVCGVIGHVDKACSKKEGDTSAEYDRSLRFLPEKRRIVGSREEAGRGEEESILELLRWGKDEIPGEWQGSVGQPWE